MTRVGTRVNGGKKFLAYLKVAVAAVGPALQSAAAVESAAFPVVETKEQHMSEFSDSSAPWWQAAV